MKKNTTSFLFASLLIVSILLSRAGAQNTSPFWSVAGNNNAVATSKLGTTNSIPLNLTTNNQTRLRIGTDGKVGIGTTSPVTFLHVVGSGSFGNRVTSANATRALNLADTAAVMRILRVDATNAPAVELISRTSADGNNVAYWDMYAQPSDKSFRIRDRTTGSNQDRLTITKTGDVGIGTTTPGYQLHVEGGTAIAAVYGNTNGTYGLYGQANTYGVYGTSGEYGVYGNGPTDGVYGSGGQYGVEGYAPGGLGFGYGVYGHSGYTGVTGSGGSYGVSGYCSSTSTGFGVYGSGGKYAGYFNGDVFSTGSYFGSDRKLKKNIEDVGTAMNIINQLHPKVYEFRQDGSYQYMHLPQGTHYGLVAQEVEQVLPNLVKETRFDTRIEIESQAKAKSNGDPSSRNIAVQGEVIDFKAVNYTELIPILVKSTQEMDKRVQDVEAENYALKQEVAELRQMLIALKGNNNATGSGNYLMQSTPNPVKGTARISYNLPEGSNRAQLQITNNLGQTIRVVQLTGSGATNVDVTSLSAGVYNYSLVIDNKIVQTKKMTVVK